jgi:hypothetical protein
MKRSRPEHSRAVIDPGTCGDENLCDLEPSIGRRGMKSHAGDLVKLVEVRAFVDKAAKFLDVPRTGCILNRTSPNRSSSENKGARDE